MSEMPIGRSSEREMEALRQSFGQTTRSWADHTFESTESGWVAFSGLARPDYNLALVHGGDAAEQVGRVIDSVTALRRPALVMLAGAGLSGAQTLADAGWVSLQAMPFMHRSTGGSRPVDGVREITEDDLPACQEVASLAFGVGPELAAAVYTAETLRRPDAMAFGLFVDDELVSCLLSCRAGDTVTGWALATHPDHRRAGHAARLIAGGKHVETGLNGPSQDLCLASPAGVPLYASLGFHTTEYWQVWSRPRWVLGAA
ncbi:MULTISPECIES: GNAT family N-acetyltransferase [Nocardiaceae]|uniref:GNAT superfamily N-acetyltransferase n=1 Tax=Rhodococcoides corynebacterioides TaxID=53972 RepID=A0ABS2L057_9NOCA|nr:MULTISPECIES: hypothetical protein [Rhodococcus]MBM7417275.1 GNAT superfamily N-acetyltransferase [Rhodococcus corynebacterioides]MBP1115528.1 GNAT superfamily N-acetyltransferase [Rhodococcus sp. PvP016]